MILLYEVRDSPDGVRVVLSGDIDLAVRADLRRTLTGVVAVSRGPIDLDLHDVTFLDCSGIGEFIRAHLCARSRGHPLTVSRPRGIVRRVLELTGVLAVLMPDGETTVPLGRRQCVARVEDAAMNGIACHGAGGLVEHLHRPRAAGR